MEPKNVKAQNFFDCVNKIFNILATLATAGIFISVMIQVIGRLVGHPAPWTEEGTRFLFIWMIFLGVGLGFRRGESARVTAFLKWTPKFVQKIQKWIYAIFSIAFFVFMFVTGIQLVGQQITTHELGSALMIPMWIIGICVPISSILGILGIIENLMLYPEIIEGGK